MRILKSIFNFQLKKTVNKRYILLFLFINRKKKDRIELEPPSDMTQEKPIPLQTPQYQQKSQPTQIPPPTTIQTSIQDRQPQPYQAPQLQQLQQNICSSCGRQLTYIPQNNRYYCYQCKKYE